MSIENMDAFEALEQQLRGEIRMLGDELGKQIRRHGGDQLFELVEKLRTLAKDRRQGDEKAEPEMEKLIETIDRELLAEIIRAFTNFFDLANLAEDRHRIRVLRHRESQVTEDKPQKETVVEAVKQLAESGASADEVRALLERLRIEPVMTAHPTEAKRRTVRNTLQLLRDDLEALSETNRSDDEAARLAKVAVDIACLWETEVVRDRKPTVLDEVDRGLFTMESLWEVVPLIYREMRQSLTKYYPGETFDVGPFLRFGSWIGGDRDGNPFVTAEVTLETLKHHRKRALGLHIQELNNLYPLFSLSARRHPVSEKISNRLAELRAKWPAFDERVSTRHPMELYRHWLEMIRMRLQALLDQDMGGGSEQNHDFAYERSCDLLADLEIMAESLKANDHQDLIDICIQPWLDRTRVFGLHSFSLDIREDSSALHEAIDQLSQGMTKPGDVASYHELDEAGKQAFLVTPFKADEVSAIDPATLNEIAQKTLALFEGLAAHLKRFDRRSLGGLIISMTHEPSDCLAMIWLSKLGAARVGGEYTPLPVAPLFETVRDLQQAPETLKSMLNTPAYVEHLNATGEAQWAMIGYSDSAKDGGFLRANWGLYKAQQQLGEAAQKLGSSILFFHGRGGALGRGGGPAARSVLSLPPEALHNGLRVTEQGEILAERYDYAPVARRHLQQLTWGTLLIAGGRRPVTPKQNWLDSLEALAESGHKAYRSLIEGPNFVSYFDHSTPIRAIERMPIGSRPSRRQTKKQRSLGDLRAIPYTFSWTQSRQLITAFYGLGAASRENGSNLAVYQEMYAEWPFFKALMDNAELALAKCDTEILEAYARLSPDAETQAIAETVIAEIKDAIDFVLKITGQDELMSKTPWLKRSVEVRNPYLDNLNLIQVALLKEHHENVRNEKQDDELQGLLWQSIQGVAAGLRTTG